MNFDHNILVFVNGRLIQESVVKAEYETGQYANGFVAVSGDLRADDPHHIEALVFGPGGLLLHRLKWNKTSRHQPNLNDPKNQTYKLE